MVIDFIEKNHEIDNVWSYKFNNKENITWKAGQYQRWELPVQTNILEDKEHWFTISSAPSDGYFQITTRNTGSNFKKKLDELKIGESIIVDTLEGDFTWMDTNIPKVFIAGGIGITPYRSILRDRSKNGLPLNVHLIYANRSEEIVFKNELDTLRLNHPELRISYITGSLTIDNIMITDQNLLDNLVYLSGPEAMVESIGTELVKIGLGKDKLKQDWFPGYTVETF